MDWRSGVGMIRSPGATAAFASRGLRATACCAAGVSGASNFAGGDGELGRPVEAHEQAAT